MTNKLHATLIVLVFLHLIYSAAGLNIFPDVKEIVIGSEGKLTLNCRNDEPIKWSYPEGISSVENKKSEYWTENGTHFNTLTINPAHYLDTGYYTCEAVNNTRNFAQIYVYVFDEYNKIASDDLTMHVSMYERIVIPCKPTSPNVTLSLTRSNTEVDSIEKYDPKIGYVIFTHPFIDDKHYFCMDSQNENEIRFTVIVYPLHNDSSNPHIIVTDSNFNYPILEKQTAIMNCSAIASTNVGVRSLEWEYPENVAKKIFVGNSTKIGNEKFNTYYRMLSVYNLTKDDNGNYTCRMVDGNFNTKTYTHFLQVEDAYAVFLNISAPEESRVITVESDSNSTVEFIATILSFPKHTFTWYDPHGHKMNSLCLYMKCDVVEDESTVKLKLKNIKLHHFGIYQLKARNAYLTKTMNYSLIVKDKPVVSVNRFHRELIKVNTTRDCECVISGYPAPQITWSAKTCQDYPDCEDGTFQKISPSMHEEKSQQAYQWISTLHLKANQSMIVLCEANNSFGHSSKPFPVLVTDYGNAVTVVNPNHSELITVGDDVEIRCSVSKYYYANSFKWTYEDDFELTPQKGKMISSMDIQIQNSTTDFSYISTLFIKNMQKNHGGKYGCLADRDNTFNFRKRPFFTSFTKISSSDIIVLDPKPPTIVQSTMKNGFWKVDLGTPVTFLIRVDGNPPPSVVWYKNGKRISLNDRITLSNNYQNLSIKNASNEDEGVYSFIASNKAGNVTERLHLSIKSSEESEYFLHIVIGILIFISISLTGMVVLYLIWRLYIAKMKLQKVLKEYGLHEQEESEATSLDPNLNIQEQTFFIPYNKKYEFPKNRLELGEELGCGAFGVVRKAVANGILVKGVKTTVAVKMAKRQNDSSCVKALTSELKIMIYLGQHLNVVNLLGACTQDLLEGELAVMVEYCEYGNLRDFLLNNRRSFANQINEHDEIDYSIIISNCYENLSFFGEPASKKKSSYVENATIGSEARLIQNYSYNPEWCGNSNDIAVNTGKTTIKTVDLICWSYQCACGMQFLANRKILHGDLAARNVLLAEGNIAKICDFGFAKSVDLDEEYKSSKTVFPIKWLAIESLLDKVFSTQTDVWAFGITMWEFFSLGDSPYPDLKITSTSDLYDTLYSGYRMEKPQFATNKIYNLMVDCWNQNPNLRPSFAQLSQELGTLLEDITPSPNIESSETDGDECSATEYSTILNSPEFDNSGRKQVRHQYVNWSPEVVNNPSNFELTDVSKDTDAAAS